MSNVIKSLTLVLLLSFTLVSKAQANELKVLTLKEFQAIQNSPKMKQESLANYEINNEEMIKLPKISFSKKIINKRSKINILSTNKLTSL